MVSFAGFGKYLHVNSKMRSAISM